jgi:hypothetical protein
MGDFLDEMAEMMSQETPTVSKQRSSEKEIIMSGAFRSLWLDRVVRMQESFEELQQLFVDMFHGDLVGEFGFGGPPPMVHEAQAQRPPSSSRSSSSEASPSWDGVNKRCSSAMGSGMPPRPGRSGSGRSGLSFEVFDREDFALVHFTRSMLTLPILYVHTQGCDLGPEEEAPWMQEDISTATGGMNKKQRLSTKQSQGLSSSSEEDETSARPASRERLPAFCVRGFGCSSD